MYFVLRYSSIFSFLFSTSWMQMLILPCLFQNLATKRGFMRLSLLFNYSNIYILKMQLSSCPLNTLFKFWNLREKWEVSSINCFCHKIGLLERSKPTTKYHLTYEKPLHLRGWSDLFWKSPRSFFLQILIGPKNYCQSKLLLPKMSFGEAGEQNSEKCWLELALVKVITNIVAVLNFSP